MKFKNDTSMYVMGALFIGFVVGLVFYHFAGKTLMETRILSKAKFEDSQRMPAQVAGGFLVFFRNFPTTEDIDTRFLIPEIDSHCDITKSFSISFVSFLDNGKETKFLFSCVAK